MMESFVVSLIILKQNWIKAYPMVTAEESRKLAYEALKQKGLDNIASACASGKCSCVICSSESEFSNTLAKELEEAGYKTVVKTNYMEISW